MNRKKVMVTMLAALAATSAWSDVSVMAEGTSYVEKGSAVGDVAVAVGTASEAKGGGTIAIGRAHATSGNAVAIGTDATASGSNSMALGQRATSKNTNSIAMGVGATSEGYSSTSLGEGSTAKGQDSMALGRGSYTDYWGSVAIGSGARAEKANSVALGANSSTTEEYTVSVGNAGMKRRIVNVDAGRNDNDVVIKKQVFGKATAAGNNTNFGAGSVAWGENSTVLAGKYNSGAIFGGTVLDGSSLAMGYHSKTTKGSSVAIGVDATTLGDRNLALGQKAKTDQWGAIAVGSGASATAGASVAIGIESQATEENTVSVGSDTRKRRIVNVDAGRNDNDAVIMRQVFGKATADGKNTNFGNSSVAWGGNSTVLAGKHFSGAIFGGKALENQAVAVGYNAEVSANQSVALGVDSKATEEKTVSVGSDKMKRRIVNVADGKADNDAVNMKQFNEVKVKSNNAVQAGTEKGSGTQAIGAGSEANGYLSMAVGSGATTKAVNRSVAIGYGSVATDNEEFSIGNDKLTRRITHVRNGNVAEGSTDAVTGGQFGK